MGFTGLTPMRSEWIQVRRHFIVVDMTRFDSHPKHGFARMMADQGADVTEYFNWVETETVPNCVRLVQGFREAGGRIVWTRVGGQFDDFADVNPNVRTLFRGAGVQRGTSEYEERDEFLPRVGEAIVDKPGASAFTTGNLDVLLRNAGVTNVVFCGVVSNACVLFSALCAWDLGYNVQIVRDATASTSREAHNAGLLVANWQGVRVSEVADVLAEVALATV